MTAMTTIDAPSTAPSTVVSRKLAQRLQWGSAIMAVAGLGFIAYAVIFFVRNFTDSFLELGSSGRSAPICTGAGMYETMVFWETAGLADDDPEVIRDFGRTRHPSGRRLVSVRARHSRSSNVQRNQRSIGEAGRAPPVPLRWRRRRRIVRSRRLHATGARRILGAVSTTRCRPP